MKFTERRVILFVVAFMAAFFSGCAASRVLVKDCQGLQGSDLQNCELVKKL